MECRLCALCVAKRSVGVYLTHLRSQHRNETINISCIVNGCTQNNFSSFVAYYRHCLRRHAVEFSRGFQPCKSDRSDNRSVQTVVSCCQEPVVITEICSIPPQIEDAFPRAAANPQLCDPASTIFKLKAAYNIPQAAANTLVSDLQAYTSSLLQDINHNIMNALENGHNELLKKCQHSVTMAFEQRFQQLNAIKTPFLRNKYFVWKMGYVSPLEITLGRSLSFQNSSTTKRRAVAKEHNMYYISLSETLKALSRDCSFEKLLNKPVREDMNIASFEDGVVYKNHPLIQKGNCLPITLYYDDVEMCNPLGSYSKVHKLAMFYFTFSSVPVPTDHVYDRFTS